MNEYPSYVPVEFIRYYEFELTSAIEKSIIEKLIFDEMALYGVLLRKEPAR
jgi:hypothetical protein